MYIPSATQQAGMGSRWMTFTCKWKKSNTLAKSSQAGFINFSTHMSSTGCLMSGSLYCIFCFRPDNSLILGHSSGWNGGHSSGWDWSNALSAIRSEKWAGTAKRLIGDDPVWIKASGQDSRLEVSSEQLSSHMPVMLHTHSQIILSLRALSDTAGDSLKSYIKKLLY